jgi:hypothetical protein
VITTSRDYFARVAEEWDSLREGYFAESVRDKAISLAKPFARETAADVGAGLAS